ncbi:S4 domain-containing protein YaaA [Streptococcus saliviloxodontae]|uniref:S4 domain protein YaaA n=1 Tax=Streptococcus saliviloxodontae TaxID=1349416 RepID=A0ABS2PKM0_9STRE|nr:S4 domain-containing protein YaaA [Streptococcus saliviloxodontae]MBM7635837.1 S4 domain protein YaaA [Streptococcus saliviloxodontae]
MEYKLFDDYITLQALLKDLRIIQSGGAIKAFLANNTVLFNGEDEKRRGKKVRLGDTIELPEHDIVITLLEPTAAERQERAEDIAEKERVAAIVKRMNQDNKKAKQNQSKAMPTQTRHKGRKPVRFPGT